MSSLPPVSPTVTPIISQPTTSDTTTSNAGPTPSDTTSSSTTQQPTSNSSLPPTSTSSSPSSAPPTPSSASSTSSLPLSDSSALSTPSLPPAASGSPSTAISSPAAPSSSQPGFSVSVYPSSKSDGGIVYVTTTYIDNTPSQTAGVTASSQGDSKGFFDNKGAVAGVFTVVGLVALALAVALMTNAIRRHRAKKFDRDVAEAAAEAAATAHAHPPDFGYDDDYGYPDRSVYTDNSHGTYSQQPMHAGENYNMSQLPPFDSYGNHGGAIPGAGNAGVGASGLNRSRSTTTPYNAFAGPQAQPPVPMPTSHDPFYDPQPLHDPYNGGPYAAAHNPQAQAGLLEAAGLAGATGFATGAALGRGKSQQQTASLSRSKSSGAQTLGSNSDHQPGTYASHYQPGFNAESHQPQPYSTYSTQSRPVSMTEDPYAGYTSTASPHSPPHNQFAAARSSSPESDEEHYTQYAHHEEGGSRMSLQDEEDYGYNNGRTVLKVANQ